MKQYFYCTIAIGLCLLQACKNKKEVEPEKNVIPISTPLVTDTTIKKEYVAEIESMQNIEIRAKVKGYLEKINVDEGQNVKAGQLLFIIRSREYDAELAKAAAEVKTATLEMQNVQLLEQKKIVSKAELALAVAKLNEAKAALGIAETNLSFTKIVAPFDGIIDRLKFKIGSLIDEGTLLTSLSNNKNVYAYFNVSELEYLNFVTNKKNNQESKVGLLLANNQLHKYQGVIQTIEGEFDKNTGNIPFRAIFPNPDFLLKHGETGKVQLTIDLKNVMLIPQKATYEVQDKTYVFVVDDNQIVHAKNIHIQQRLPNLYVIDDGLLPNDKIIIEGVQTVKEDDKVTTSLMNPRTVINNLQLIK
ncbi:efflux RND transporter periplasmic adaptor subunit [Ferruginibacter yonginensis]|uniref:Efflux RND transporter periplasmic adaptor subunit n=1 Tax=Ferruginibacter yonginensis TaxID=1310416 RepID=A0ABV8QXM6_9BACT